MSTVTLDSLDLALSCRHAHTHNNHQNSSLLKRKKKVFKDRHTWEREKESENKQTLFQTLSNRH